VENNRDQLLVTVELILLAAWTKNKSTHKGPPISPNLPSITMHYLPFRNSVSLSITIQETFQIPHRKLSTFLKCNDSYKSADLLYCYFQEPLLCSGMKKPRMKQTDQHVPIALLSKNMATCRNNLNVPASFNIIYTKHRRSSCRSCHHRFCDFYHSCPFFV